jgi:hypothetical protein
VIRILVDQDIEGQVLILWSGLAAEGWAEEEDIYSLKDGEAVQWPSP